MTRDLVKMAKEVTMKSTPEEAISATLRAYIEQKVSHCETNIRRFERKYGMSYEEFDRRIQDIEFSEKLGKEKGIINVENDYFDWGGFVTELSYFNERLRDLD